MLEGYVTTKKAMEITGYSYLWVYLLASNGKVNAVQVGKSWMIEKKSLIEYAERQGREVNDG